MEFLLKPKSFSTEKFTRKRFKKNEIFFKSYFIIKQTRYSKNLDYFSFKTRISNIFLTKIKNCCIQSGKFKSINTKLKLSHIKFSEKIDSGLLSGFYRSLW
jgi:ribosomal protein S14